MPHDDEELSRAQLVFWQGMTDQRVANIFLMADVFGAMGHDGLAFLRALGDPEYRAMRRFLLEADPATFKFLMDIRGDEVTDVADAIETARSIRRTMRIVRWGFVTMAATFLGIVAVWDKLVALFSVRGR